MRKEIIPFIFSLFLILLTFLHARQNSKIPEKYKKWLEQEVIYIITSKEEKAFKQLETDKQRDLFIEEFWRQRDPVISTPQNEFRDEHYRRIEYASKRFKRGSSKPGWKTDRGRIYIILGDPYPLSALAVGRFILWKCGFIREMFPRALNHFFILYFSKDTELVIIPSIAL